MNTLKVFNHYIYTIVLTKNIIQGLLNPDASKVLTTNGPAGLNIIPVSSIKVVGGNIWLIDYFFGKTGENAKVNSNVH